MQLAVICQAKSALNAIPAVAAVLALVLLAGPAHADSVFIPQLAPDPTGAQPPFALPSLAPPETSPNPSTVPAVVPSPATASSTGSGRNFALTTVFGNFNQTVQVQLGTNDQSALGVFGNNDTAGVFQAGNNLRSDVAVLGQNLAVGVIEPDGSPPVDLLIARLPSGRLLIAR